MKHPFLLTLTQWIGVACLMASVAAIAVFIWLLPQPSLPPLAATDTIAETPAYTPKFPTNAVRLHLGKSPIAPLIPIPPILSPYCATDSNHGKHII